MNGRIVAVFPPRVEYTHHHATELRVKVQHKFPLVFFFFISYSKSALAVSLRSLQRTHEKIGKNSTDLTDDLLLIESALPIMQFELGMELY